MFRLIELSPISLNALSNALSADWNSTGKRLELFRTFHHHQTPKQCKTVEMRLIKWKVARSGGLGGRMRQKLHRMGAELVEGEKTHTKNGQEIIWHKIKQTKNWGPVAGKWEIKINQRTPNCTQEPIAFFRPPPSVPLGTGLQTFRFAD